MVFRMPKEQYLKAFKISDSIVYAKDYVEEDGVVTFPEK